MPYMKLVSTDWKCDNWSRRNSSHVKANMPMDCSPLGKYSSEAWKHLKSGVRGANIAKKKILAGGGEKLPQKTLCGRVFYSRFAESKR